MGRKVAGRKPSSAGLRGKDRHANVTDPDSRIMRSRQGFLQGYNAQAAVTGEQIIVAAAVVTAANDLAQLAPLLAATEANLHAISHEGGVGTVVADAGYWSTDNATLDTDARVLIATVPATMGITDPNDPRIAQRDAVLHRWDRGEINTKTAAAEMGVSEPWARKLLADRRRNVADPAVVRAAMDAELATDSGRAASPAGKSPSSPCSARSKPPAATAGSVSEGYKQCAPSGRSSALPTTSPSSGATLPDHQQPEHDNTQLDSPPEPTSSCDSLPSGQSVRVAGR